MLCARSLEFNHLLTTFLFPVTSLHNSLTPHPLVTTIPLCFYEFALIKFYI